eukprot:c19889_g1_i1 orf=1-1077(-)
MNEEEEEEEAAAAAVQQFCSLTNCSPQQARFFLESCSWQLESAVQNFYETDSGEALEHGPQAEEEQDRLPLSAHTSLSPSAAFVSPSGNLPQPFRLAGDAAGNGTLPASRSNKPAKDKQAGSSSRGGVRTLSDLDGLVDSDGDSDRPQEYYTGGEKSGMLVQDPSKGNRDVDAIFDQARRMGAQEGPLEQPQAPSSNRNIFTGIGHTIGGGMSEQELGQSSQVTPIVRNITFWRNGFTVDDGPLRRLDDPANAQFLASISKSICPKELEPANHSSPVDVNLIRKDEDWQPPPEPKHVPFRGVGRTLGSSDAPEVGSDPTSRTVSNQPFQGLVVDESKLVTSIQLRLSDGTRMVARFNHH